MKLEKTRYEDVLILRFVGEFDTFNLPGFQERVEKMVEGGDVRFVMDVRLLKFINSSALGYLIRLSKQLRERGGDLLLARPSKFLKKTLLTLGLEEVFKIFETVEDALLHFRKGATVGAINLEGSEYDESLTGAVPLLFRPRAAGDDDAAPNQVGRIVTLYEDGLLFRYDPAGEIDPVELDLRPGNTLKLKFRQPFATKERYFEMDARVQQVSEIEGETKGDATVTVRVLYDKIADEDRDILRQFVKDQASWRAELKS
jgi:anti-anti-sigma factor